MSDQPRIKYRPDGSIDTAYYTRRGRQMRSQQAHRLAAKFMLPNKPARNAGPFSFFNWAWH